MPDLILASTSSTRIALLEKAGLVVSLMRPIADEEEIKQGLIAEGATSKELARLLAEVKGQGISMAHPGAYVISADQVLDLDGIAFSKPVDKAGARTSLQQLSGKTHKLHTCVVIHHQGRMIWHHMESPKLSMRPLSDDQLSAYLKLVGDAALWSVGCYQLEGLGSQLFSHVEGDYFSILGLPLLPLLNQLRLYRIDGLDGQNG